MDGRKREKVLLAIYFFFVTSTFGFLQPFLPVYLESSGISREQIGFIMGLGAGLALLIQPLLGRLTDQINSRKPVILASSLLAFFAYALIPVANGLVPILTLVAVGANATMFLNSAGGVLVGRLVQASQGGDAYSRIRIWGSVGYAITSLTTGVIVTLTSRTMDRAALNPIFLGGSLLFVGVAIVTGFLSDGGKEEGPAPGPVEKAPLPPNLKWFLAAYFLYNFALYGASSFLSIFVKSLGAQGLGVTGIFAAAVMVEIFVMPWVGRFSDRFGRRPILAISFLLLPIRLLLYIPAPNPVWVLAVQSLHGINFGIMGALSVVFANDLSTDRTRGQAQGRLFAVAGMATALGPVLFGVIAQRANLQWMFGTAAVIAFCAAVIFMQKVEDSHESQEPIENYGPQWLRPVLRWLAHPPKSQQPSASSR